MITLEKALRHMAWSNQNIIKEISKIPDDIYSLRAAVGECSKTLIEAASQSDAEIAFTNDEGGLELTTRSMVLTQAVTHTAEHKGQLATTLRVNDFHLDLDKFDLWNFK